MSLRRSENDRTPNDTTGPTHWHTLPGSDSVKLPGVAETSKAATLNTNYIYYRIYAEDGAIPSKTPATPGDLFLGRIKARSVPPPHTAKAIKHSIAKVENIEDRMSTSLFLTPYSQSPMHDAEKVTILNRTGPGSTPQEPLALVAKLSDSERSALGSGGRSGLASAQAAEPDTTPSEIRYLYYLLYADEYEMPSKAAFDPEEPSLGRIRADFIAPPHSLASIKRCISRVERTPALAHANIFADISCDAPLKEGCLSILRGPGLSPNVPMAIVQMPIIQVPIVQVKNPSIPDGRYVIKNRAGDIYWNSGDRTITKVYFSAAEMVHTKLPHLQWDITHDTNGNIFMTSPYAPSSWVGAEIIGSTVPVPWRLIPVDGKFYYLTTNMDRVSQNPRVPAAHPDRHYTAPGLMATLKEGDKWQMWEFIRISSGEKKRAAQMPNFQKLPRVLLSPAGLHYGSTQSKDNPQQPLKRLDKYLKPPS